ncbi:uncharacterized protein SCHCODRAFT_02512870, partial [Schizophyllum commune H4-8]|uniref:uncharacterized protein n=1 Tax=Schizophyllum commune (strain H4-8 / FGSC 9210) TaxID=578458 RepID=UPI00215F67B2
RMGEIGDPWGMPFATGFMSPRSPSRHIATSRSERKLATHCTYGRGRPSARSTCSRRV